jgi:hypothetical protein
MAEKAVATLADGDVLVLGRIPLAFARHLDPSFSGTSRA